MKISSFQNIIFQNLKGFFMKNGFTKTYKFCSLLGFLSLNLLLTTNSFTMSEQSTKKSKASYAIRSKSTKNGVLKKLFEIIDSKKTNLALAADITDKERLLELLTKVGSEICLLKMHIDIIKDVDHDFINSLKLLSEMHNFLIIEDRKFADIGSVVQEQYTGGTFRIADWADIVISHVISGPDIIKALKEASQEQIKMGNMRGLLILAQMSSSGNLMTKEYTAKVVEMAQVNKDFVMGFIAQESLTEDSDFVTCTPGVNIEQTKDNLGQNYNSPDYVIKTKLSDIVIVGRGICNAKDPLAAAKQYREMAWNAYQERLNS